MRCLRCAIDYEPDERFCHRCGRALSRIPGSPDPVEQGMFSAVDETAFLYSTHVPPGVPDVPAEGGAQQPDAETEGYLPADHYGWTEDEDHAWQEHSGTYGGVRAAQEEQQSGSVYIVPPMYPDEDAPPSRVLTPVDDPEDVLTAFRIKPASIGGEMPSRRQSAPPPPPRAGLVRVVLVAALVLIVAGIGGVALIRHNAFARDLTAAQQLEASGQLDAAGAGYTKAAGEWPFHGAADDGIASIMATVTTRQATATAVAYLAAAQATAVVSRVQIFQAHLAVRRLDAQQQDANVYATATAQAQARAASVAQATAGARAHATAAVQTATAVITGRATATAIARANATVLASLNPGTSGVAVVSRAVSPSVVRVVAPSGDGTARVGTGVVVATDAGGSFIVTNDHVIDGGTRIGVSPETGGRIPVVTLAANQDADLAVLYVKTALPVVQWGEGAGLSVGQPVVAIGYAEDLAGTPTVTFGFLSALSRDDGAGHTFLQHTAAINHGNSGGPLLDMGGRILGINTLTLVGTQGLFFAIPAPVAHPIASTLIKQIQGGGGQAVAQS